MTGKHTMEESKASESTERTRRTVIGYYIKCPNCSRVIPDTEWSCSDEWLCDCGESGIVDDSDL